MSLLNKSKSKGCLLTVLAISFVIGSGFYFLTTGIREAKRQEQTLIDRFGWADQYTPSIDGAITSQRMEAFIRVREAVQPNCTDYQGVLKSINNLDNLENDQESSAGEVATMSLQSFKSIFSAGPKMVEFSETRNQALLAGDMGLGEYIYIYLATYGEQLASEATSAYSGMEEAYLSDRARKEFVQMLANQIRALESSGQQASFPDLANTLRAEMEALKAGSHSSPWPDGAPGMAWESIAPFQQQLEDLYCSGIVKIELLQKNRGFQLEN